MINLFALKFRIYVMPCIYVPAVYTLANNMADSFQLGYIILCLFYFKSSYLVFLLFSPYISHQCTKWYGLQHAGLFLVDSAVGKQPLAIRFVSILF